MKSRIIKYFGYILILTALCFAFFRGKKQGELDCIDFNVLPVIANTLTISGCLLLMSIGIILIERKLKK